MQLVYKDTADNFIKNDLKRLKRLSSLEEDLKELYNIKRGLLDEPNNFFCYCSENSSLFGSFIAKTKKNDKTLYFYKDRLPITKPFMTASEGARVVFCVVKEDYIFMPMLIFSAKEEKTFYDINNRKIKLTSSNLFEIIKEKFNNS